VIESSHETPNLKSRARQREHLLPPLRSLDLSFVTTSYRPALEVGGDFFQIIPHPTDGSLLIVASDVMGKGLKAGMLVALLVGAIRSTTELNGEPLFILQALNRRLMGRGPQVFGPPQLWLDSVPVCLLGMPAASPIVVSLSLFHGDRAHGWRTRRVGNADRRCRLW
jgi:Stage II sporulation protein E (SpoIIE)